MKCANSQLGAVFFLLATLLLYLLIIGPFAAYMTAKPIEEKLGYVPSAQVIRPLAAGMNEFSAAVLVTKVMMYFGGIFDERENLVQRPPDYPGMARLLDGAVTLDPYNMDAYYFAQSFLVWETGEIERANAMLDIGMKYRTWDWYLPFFAGFNSAYFLKDYDKAAGYYKRAADLTGEKLFIGLAGRYMQEAGQTEMAILYLKGMLANARNPLEKETYATRLKAFDAVRQIELARDLFCKEQGRLPIDLDELVRHHYLMQIPADPYDGRFHLLDDGKVATTSKFAFGVAARLESKKK